jgi:hypothetical protein
MFWCAERDEGILRLSRRAGDFLVTIVILCVWA